jgi:Na+-driven multidrug efflux pump
MISQITGAVFNIIFDPLLIFGLCGFPKLGVAGAAYATVLGQCVAAVLSLILNVLFNKEINIKLSYMLRPSLNIIGRI